MHITKQNFTQDSDLPSTKERHCVRHNIGNVERIDECCDRCCVIPQSCFALPRNVDSHIVGSSSGVIADAADHDAAIQ